jgi:O-antigen ligase
VKFLRNSYGRNLYFPFVLAFSLLLTGSLSTGIFAGAAIFAVFFNPRASAVKIFYDAFNLCKEYPILWLLPLYLFWLLSTSLTAESPLKGISYIGTQWQMFFILPVSIGLYKLSSDANIAAIFSRGLRLALIPAFALAIVQMLFWGQRPEGFNGNALVFANMCAVSGGLAFTIWDEEQKYDRQLAALALFAAIGITIFSFSRGMIFSMMCISLLALVYHWQILKLHLYNRTTIIGTIGFVAIIASLLSFSTTFYSLYELRILKPINSLLEGGFGDQSISERATMFKAGWDVMLDEPLFGNGMQNTIATINQHLLEQETGQSFSYSHLHNDYLNHVVAGGFPLLILFILVLWLPLFCAIKLNKSFKNRAGILYFSGIISIGFSAAALTNIALRHDLLATYFSAGLCFIIVALKQDQDQIINVYIPEFWKTVKTGTILVDRNSYDKNDQIA